MKKCILIIVVAILPIILCFSIVKGTFGTDTIVSSKSFYEYFLTYPKEDVQNLIYEFSTFDDIGFASMHKFEYFSHYEYDTDGNRVWVKVETLQGLGNLLADFFNALWEYIVFMIKVSYLIVRILITSVVWILGFPAYIGINFTTS